MEPPALGESALTDPSSACYLRAASGREAAVAAGRRRRSPAVEQQTACCSDRSQAAGRRPAGAWANGYHVMDAGQCALEGRSAPIPRAPAAPSPSTTARLRWLGCLGPGVLSMASACPRPVAISGWASPRPWERKLAGTWEKLSNGVSGTAHLEGFSYRGKPLPVGRCPTAALTDSLVRAGRVLDEEQPRALTLAECVATQALSATSAKDPERIGLYLGSSLTTSDYVARGYERYFAGKRPLPRRWSTA